MRKMSSFLLALLLFTGGATSAAAAEGRTDLPQGHPPVDGSPHGTGDSPHGQGSQFYRPPADSINEDTALPAGTIDVFVRDAEDKPLPDAPVRLQILHRSVAKGDSTETLHGKTNAEGLVRFEDRGTGTDTEYGVTTLRGPATFSTEGFMLSQSSGKRVVVHAYESSDRIDSIMAGMQGTVYMALREQSIAIEQLYTVFNLGPVAWVADVTIDLPTGFKAFQTSEKDGILRVEAEGDRGVRIRGTVPPGRSDINFRYQVPLDGSEAQGLRMPLPPRVFQLRVIAEATKDMSLSVTGFPSAENTRSPEGKRVLLTDRQASPSEPTMPPLEIKLGGLPTPGNGRIVALVLALGALILGFVYVLLGSRSTIASETKSELLEAKKALLDELALLERAHEQGDVGPKSYAHLKEALLDALGAILERIDGLDHELKSAQLERAR